MNSAKQFVNTIGKLHLETSLFFLSTYNDYSQTTTKNSI